MVCVTLTHTHYYSELSPSCFFFTTEALEPSTCCYFSINLHILSFQKPSSKDAWGLYEQTSFPIFFKLRICLNKFSQEKKENQSCLGEHKCRILVQSVLNTSYFLQKTWICFHCDKYYYTDSFTPSPHASLCSFKL